MKLRLRMPAVRFQFVFLQQTAAGRRKITEAEQEPRTVHHTASLTACQHYLPHGLSKHQHFQSSKPPTSARTWDNFFEKIYLIMGKVVSDWRHQLCGTEAVHFKAAQSLTATLACRNRKHGKANRGQTSLLTHGPLHSVHLVNTLCLLQYSNLYKRKHDFNCQT